MRGLFPGTFDPITAGHEDLIQRAIRLCDHVIIGVAKSAGKQPLFEFEQRFELISQRYAGEPKISVVAFSGMLVDFCKQHQVDAVIRGLRSTIDFEYEKQLAEMNKRLDEHFETLFLTSNASLSCVSSTLVREIARLGGNYQSLVSPLIAQALQAKFS